MRHHMSRTARLLVRSWPQTAVGRRMYAQQAPESKARSPQPEGVSGGSTTRLPLITALGLAALIPLFYFTQGTTGIGNKSPGSGQATIKETRREKGTQNEYRDPRDSGKKTTEADGKKT